MGKNVALYGKKQKLNHVMSVKTDTVKCSSRPGPIRCEKKNFISCPFRKLSRQEKQLCFSLQSEPSTQENCLSAGGFPCDAIQSSSQGSLLVVHLSRPAKQ